MNAKAIVDRLLEADPDELDPRSELLRNDPAQDIKEIVRALQDEDVTVLGYSRAGAIVKMLVRLTNWMTDRALEDWLQEFFAAHAVELGDGVITASNMAYEQGMSAGRSYKIFFPLEGPPITYQNLVTRTRS